LFIAALWVIRMTVSCDRTYAVEGYAGRLRLPAYPFACPRRPGGLAHHPRPSRRGRATNRLVGRACSPPLLPAGRRPRNSCSYEQTLSERGVGKPGFPTPPPRRGDGETRFPHPPTRWEGLGGLRPPKKDVHPVGVRRSRMDGCHVNIGSPRGVWGNRVSVPPPAGGVGREQPSRREMGKPGFPISSPSGRV